MNGSLTPDDVTVFSGKKVWWRCSKNESHVWEAAISGRSAGNGCPHCSNRFYTHTGTSLSDENRLSLHRPDLVAQWHPSLNADLTPEQVTVSSTQKAWWQCPEYPDHVWLARVQKRNAGQGCPFCANQRLADSNRLSISRPDIARQWHPTLNGSLTADDVMVGTTRRVWWKCEAGDDHVWQTKVVSRTHGAGAGCPFCSGLRLCDTNRLSIQRPDIAAEWHPTKNGDLTPDQVTVASDKYAWWTCPDNPSHSWRAVIKSRTRLDAGCPSCSMAQESTREVRIRHELGHLLGFPLDVVRLRIDGKRISVDMAHEGLKLAIEYDGCFWHQAKTEKDIAKTELLASAGWRVIRIREKPLERLGQEDLIVAGNSPLKPVMDVIVRHLLSLGVLPQDKADEYLDRPDAMNQSAADAYIRTKRRRKRNDGERGESSLQ